jgi:hypothetical protein
MAMLSSSSSMCWHVYRQVCLSLMARSEYAAMEKQGQRKLRSVLVHLIEWPDQKCWSDSLSKFRIPGEGDVKNSHYRSRAVRKAEKLIPFGISDTGRWRCQELSLQES